MNITQFMLILKARKWIILGVLLLTVGVTVAVSLMLPKKYTATTTLIIDSKSKDPFTGQLLPSQLFPGYMATQIDVIKSASVAQKLVSELKLADSPGTQEQFMEATGGEGDIKQWLGNLLLTNLSVEPSRESSIISISFSGSDPNFAALMSNAFAKAYIDTSLELRLMPARQTVAWFDQQITQLRENLDKAQQKLTNYQREKGIIESEERLDVETRRLGDVAGQMVAAQSTAYAANSRALDSRAMPEVFNSPAVQNLKASVAHSEGKLADLAKRVGPNHPEFQRLQAESDSYKIKLATELSTAAKGVGASSTAARQSFNQLEGAFANQKTRVLGLKQQREQATLLARDLENAQRIYDAALQRYGQSRMEAQSTQTDITILDPAVAPIRPSKPKVLLNVVLSVFLGSMLGIGTGFFVELKDRRLRSKKDIADGLGVTVLA